MNNNNLKLLEKQIFQQVDKLSSKLHNLNKQYKNFNELFYNNHFYIIDSRPFLSKNIDELITHIKSNIEDDLNSIPPIPQKIKEANKLLEKINIENEFWTLIDNKIKQQNLNKEEQNIYILDNLQTLMELKNYTPTKIKLNNKLNKYLLNNIIYKQTNNISYSTTNHQEYIDKYYGDLYNTKNSLWNIYITNNDNNKYTNNYDIFFNYKQSTYQFCMRLDDGKFNLYPVSESEDTLLDCKNSDVAETIYKQIYKYISSTDKNTKILTNTEYKICQQLENKNLFPKKMDFNFVKNLTEQQFNKMNNLIQQINKKTGLLIEPIIIINDSTVDYFENGEILSLSEAKDKLLNFNFQSLPEKTFSDHIKFKTIITPSHIENNFIKFSKNDESQSIIKKLEQKCINKKTDLDLTEEEQELKTYLYDTSIKRINSIYKNQRNAIVKYENQSDIAVKNFVQNNLNLFKQERENIIDINFNINDKKRDFIYSIYIDYENKFIKGLIKSDSLNQNQEMTNEQIYNSLILARDKSIISDKQFADFSNLLDKEQEIYQSSKNKKTINQLSEEDINNAKSVSIVEIAQANGFNLTTQKGKEIRFADNHSMTINVETNTYIDWADDTYKGDSISFVRQVVGIKDFKDAVNYINSGNFSQVNIQQIEKEEFQYDSSKEVNHIDNATSYLVNKRGINPNLIKILNQQGLIKEDFRKNIIFIHKKDNQIVGASEQGTRKLTNSNNGRSYWKSIQKNSENFGFNFQNGKPQNLKFFESPIDAMSYVSLYGVEKDTRYVSMDGLKKEIVYKHIKNVSQQFKDTDNKIKNISLCVDNDSAGKQFVEKFANFIKKDSGEQLFKSEIPPIPQNSKLEKMDWNDILKIYRQNQQKKKEQTLQKQSELEL